MNLLYKTAKANIKAALLLCISLACLQQGFTQLNPFGAGYYQNQYLLNPAMAGLKQELKLNGGYRRESASISDAISSQYLTGEYGLNSKMGVGLNLYNDLAGLLRTTRAMATYSYHIALNEKGRALHLGVSGGVVNKQVDNGASNGETGDPLLSRGSTIDIDADLGIAYTDGRLTVQGAFPGMVTYFGKDEEDVVNRPMYFAAASYKFLFNDDEIILEPKVAYRGIEGNDNILDAGAAVLFKDKLQLFGMYHSTESITVGAGAFIKKQLTITAMYNTGATGVKGYTDGSFEIGIGLSILNRE